MTWYGDHPVGVLIVFDFSTTVNGVLTTFSGSPALSVYKNSTTESTAGITLTVDYDGRTGFNHVVIDTTADGTFYATDNKFDVVITTGTLGGVSQVGVVIGAFSVTTRQTNLNFTTNAIGRGTVTTGATTTSIPTSAFAPSGAVANQYVGRVVLFDGNTTTTALRGQVAVITASSNAAAPTFTVAALTTAPASGDLFSVI